MTQHKAKFIIKLPLIKRSPRSLWQSHVTTTGNRGFTLVELLMVIMIIAGLAAIIIPSYNNYVSKASNSRAMSEIRTLSTEISGYALDHNGNYPREGDDLFVDIQRQKFQDPWKRDYVYKSSPELKDPFGFFLNEDFDVYSKGIDGASAPDGGDPSNKDDIARTNKGAYVGLREPE